jgi:hypothetical protein
MNNKGHTKAKEAAHCNDADRKDGRFGKLGLVGRGAMKEPRNNDMKVGSRFRLSALGIKRCRKAKSRTGLVVGLSPTGSSVRVIFEGRRQPITLHESYVEPDLEHPAHFSGVLLRQTAK